MTTRPFEHFVPEIGEGVYIDPTALVIGQVRIGRDSSIWPMAIVRGDVHAITIGERTSVQDGCVLHVTHAGPYHPEGHDLVIGNDVTIGHKAMLHGCQIGNECLIGMGSVVMDGAVVEDHVVLGAGSIVPPGRTLTSGHLWVGSPARKIRPLTDEEMAFFKYSARNYVHLKNRYLASQ
ncbi:MAG: gamma carbonic anhydrase family protein [Gammaproteobacteria bacterium]|nr:MAG: gamma carbonic anhydrase family protein [Gammaproteobacteria bacterium]